MAFNFIAEMAAYTPCCSVEVQSRQRFIDLISDNSDPTDRTTYDPGHITSSAFIVSSAEKRILLVFHRKLRRWLQPGGHMEVGDESPMSAASRELLEETGIQATACPYLFDLDIHKIPARNDQPAHLHFDMRYLFQTDGMPSHAAGDELAVWFSEQDLAALDLDAGILRMIEKAKQQALI